MKKSILTTFLCVSLTGLFSQEGPYVSFNSGVAFSAAPDAIGQVNTTTSGGDFTNTNIYGTFGRGVNLTLRAGFKNSQHFGVDLGVNYLLGFKSKIGEVSSSSSEGMTETKHSLLRIMPGVVFATDNAALTLYSRTGLVLPVSSSAVREQNLTSSGTTTYQKTESTGGFSLGYFGAVGVSVKAAESLKIFAEVEGINLRVKQKTAVLTEFTVNNNDQLGSLNTQDKEALYVDEVTSADNTNTSEPRKVLAQTINYSSLGFNIGLRFNF